MTKEEVLCILEAPGWALQDVERAYERYERAYSRCTGGAIRYDKEGTSGGGGDPDMPLIIFAARSTELDIAKARYKAAKQRAESLIGLLEDWRKRAVLTGRYVAAPALTWPELAETLSVSERQTYRMKNDAIDALCVLGGGPVLAAVS